VRSDRVFSWFLVPAVAWLLALFLIPIGFSLLISLGTIDVLGRPVYGLDVLTLENYREVIDPIFRPVLVRTVIYAVLTVLFCLLLGYPLAYFIAFYGRRWKLALLVAIIVPFFVNYLIRVYAWVTILSANGVVNGLFDTDWQMLSTQPAVVGGLVYGYLTFMILPIYAALDRMDTSVIEAARDLYASPFEVFRRVTLPYSMPGVLAGIALVLLPASGDFFTAQALGGGQYPMIGNVIQENFLGGGTWPEGAAFVVVLAVLVFVFMAFYVRSTLKRAREAF